VLEGSSGVEGDEMMLSGSVGVKRQSCVSASASPQAIHSRRKRHVLTISL